MTAAPNADTVEVSLFGPGRGESCVIHLGAGDWIVVDSCDSQALGGNPALNYLAAIGVDVSSQVKLVVATHAHDDHIDGIADIVLACRSAEVVWPAASHTEEFYSLLRLDEENSLFIRPATFSQYRKTIEILVARHGGRPRIKRALADRPLWTRSAPSARVVALAPSDEAVTRSIEIFHKLLDDPVPKGRVATGDPNTFSVALWVEAGDACMLLGGDLLTGPGDNCGWNAVLSSTTRPDGKASIYKVAHHGSPTSHLDDIWTKLLQPDSVAIIAPFRGSQNPRPAAVDITRIKGLAGATYATAPTKAPRNRTPSVRKTAASLQQIARNVTPLATVPGHIRARCPITGGPWTVDTVAPASKL